MTQSSDSTIPFGHAANLRRPRHGTAAMLALAALILGGCAATRTAETGGADAALRAVEAGYRSTPDMALEGTVRVSGMGVTVWVDALIRGRDSLKITLTGPFAIPLGAMSATRDAFEFYKADEDIILYGTPDRRTFEKLLMIPLDYDELVALLRGEIPRVPQQGEFDVRAEGEVLLYTVKRDNRVETIAVEPATATIRNYDRSRVESESTVPELAIAYSRFEPFGERRLARRASVDVGGGLQTISVTVDDVAATIPADASLALDVGPGVERYPFRP